jgi:hypothetical protein
MDRATARQAHKNRREEAMKSRRAVPPPQHRVIAQFEGSSLSFPLPREATFWELVDRLAALGQSHGGVPIGVAVTIGA